MITDFVFYLAAIPAVMVLGLSKGGFSGLGMVALPIMALVVPPLQGAAIILPILMAQDVVSLYAFRKTWSRDVILRFMPGALAGLCAGALLAAYVSDAMVELLVGLLAGGFCIVHWTKREAADAPPRQPTRAKGLALGALSGFASFIANTGGVPFQAYAVPLRMAPAFYAGTSTALFFVLNWIKFRDFHRARTGVVRQSLDVGRAAARRGRGDVLRRVAGAPRAREALLRDRHRADVHPWRQADLRRRPRPRRILTNATGSERRRSGTCPEIR